MINPIDPNQINPQKLYTLEQVADFLNLCYSSVLKLKKEGAFKTIKTVGRRIYIRGASIKAFIEKG